MHVANLRAQASKGHYFQDISVSHFNYYITSAPQSLAITGNKMYCSSKRLSFNYLVGPANYILGNVKKGFFVLQKKETVPGESRRIKENQE
jgi:hypothetical protein